MNYIDLIILAPLLWGAVRGFMKGFIISVSGLLALVLGIYGAVLLSDHLGLYLADEHGFEGAMMPFVAFALVFLGIVIGIHFLGRLIQKAIQLAALGLADKMAGGVFGIARAVLILSVVVLLLEKVNEYIVFLPRPHLAESTLYEPLADVTQEYFPKIADSRAFKDIIQAVEEAQKEMEGVLE